MYLSLFCNTSISIWLLDGSKRDALTRFDKESSEKQALNLVSV